MFRSLALILTPDAYHGRGVKPPFFEGWYYKLVDASGEHRYAVIPGIYQSRNRGESHAFIQVSDGSTGQAAYSSYPVSRFSSPVGRFDIRIGENSFSTRHLMLNIEDQDLVLKGSLSFTCPFPWPVTLCSPGVMGWYAWAPFLECYHGVVSLDHGIEGALMVNGEEISFSGGRGYTEKDWGRSFPSAWVWMQTNHFQDTGTSLTASMAVVPWIGRSFAGFTAGLLHQGRLFRFATYTGARVDRLEITEKQVFLTMTGSRHRLEIEAELSEGSLLRAPSVMAMDRRISETLTATVHVALHAFGKGRSRELFSGTGRSAGLEAAGDLSRLLDMWRRERNRRSIRHR